MFGVAGVAKLADRAGSRRALVDFGVPSALASPLGILLPFAELAFAIALLPLSTAWIGAVGALALLLLFVVAIGINLARGRQPDCHCFGQISSSPAGWSTLARNVLLSLVALLVIMRGPGASATAWIGDLTTPQRLLFVVGLVALALIVAEGLVLLQVLRQQGRLLLRLDALEPSFKTATSITPAVSKADDETAAGLKIGTSAPAFRIKGLHGERLTLQSLLAAGKPLLLFFTDPNCGPCKSLMPDIGRYQDQHSSALTIALISEGKPEANRVMAKEYGLNQVLVQKDREVAESYEAYGTPCAVLVQPDGTIGSALAMGADAVRALVAQASTMAVPTIAAAPSALPHASNGSEGSSEEETSPPEIGQAAPHVKLQDLHGKSFSLQSYRGSETLLLFWNPDCGFCQQMFDDLKAMDASPSPGAPKLLVISSGTAEDGAAMNLRSKIVLDKDFTVGPAFGAGGTPMAVLVDAKGRIASEVAAGAQAVLALARAQQN